MELKGKTALITGASGKLGYQIAIGLARAGVNCVCQYHSDIYRAQELVGKLVQLGVCAKEVQADLSSQQQIEEMFEEALKIGIPQILINSAGVFTAQRLEDVDAEIAEKTFKINLTSAILAGKEFAKKVSEHFAEGQGVAGKIINIADVGGIMGWAGYVVYCASKAGLIGATKAMAKELAPAICVNAIAPGVIAGTEDIDPDQLERQLGFIPAGRLGKPEDIVKAVMFLLESDYVTGQVLRVDGGRCI